MKRSLLLLFIISFILSSCKFDYSPYEATESAYPALRTDKNIERIQKLPNQNRETFKVAVISDTHYYYDALSSIVDILNNRKDIDFVILGGDYSDQGLKKEYDFFAKILKNLNKPVLTVIGNHDYLASAEISYDNIFGSRNYVMDFDNYHFIFFDNIFWESGKKPDFDWLKNQAKAGQETGKQNILVAHIPPFAEQYTQEYKELHNSILKDYNIHFSIHGHLHDYSYQTQAEGIYQLVVSTIGVGEYCTVTFSKDTQPEVERIFF